MTLDNDAIVGYLDSLDKQTRAIKNEALRMTWYMRGGISYDDAMALSYVEKNIISEIIKENMETTKKSGLPFF